MELDTPQNVVHLKNGNMPTKDTNGNYFSLTFQGTRLTSSTDTLKRTSSFPNFDLTVPDSNGNSRSFTVQSGSSPVAQTTFPSQTCGSAQIHQGNWGSF